MQNFSAPGNNGQGFGGGGGGGFLFVFQISLIHWNVFLQEPVDLPLCLLILDARSLMGTPCVGRTFVNIPSLGEASNSEKYEYMSNKEAGVLVLTFKSLKF